MSENNQPKPPSWEEEIFESINPSPEENKYFRWVDSPRASNSSLPPPPAPEITPSSLLDSKAFDAIVQKLVEINTGMWIFPKDAPILVRAVLKAIAEVNKERNERQDQQ